MGEWKFCYCGRLQSIATGGAAWSSASSVYRFPIEEGRASCCCPDMALLFLVALLGVNQYNALLDTAAVLLLITRTPAARHKQKSPVIGAFCFLGYRVCDGRIRRAMPAQRDDHRGRPADVDEV